jgi:hypothetical protein
MTIRLTTTAPISYIIDEVPFEIYSKNYLILQPDESLKSPIAEMSESFLQKTFLHWSKWSRTLSVCIL